MNNSFVCDVFSGYSPDKNPNSKYYVSDNEYNKYLYGIDFYSNYCFGPGFIMTTDLISKLSAQSNNLKLSR